MNSNYIIRQAEIMSDLVAFCKELLHELAQYKDIEAEEARLKEMEGAKW